MSDVGITLVTAPDLEQARRLARSLVETRLAACVNLCPVQSIYRWEGETQEDDEILLVIKSRVDRRTAIEEYVRRAHSYEVPECIHLDVAGGLPPYVDWVIEATSSDDG